MLASFPRLLPAAFVFATNVSVFATPTFAADGVLEINHTCATVAGCFAGDDPGYPVTIYEAAGARSFRLTSDLALDTVAGAGIRVHTGHVQIDLGGFAIRGPVTCGGAPLVCSVGGSGDGVVANLASLPAIGVRNGAVTGMGRFGVFLGASSVVENVRVTENASSGIYLQQGATVRDATVASNGGSGIWVGRGSVVERSTSYANKVDGILAASQATVVGNAVRENGGRGIAAGSGSTLAHNTSVENASHGIYASSSTVSDNSVYANTLDGIHCPGLCTIAGNTVTGSVGDGIDSAGGGVRGNSVGGNGTYGLRLGLAAAYRENVVTGNTSGGVSGGVNLGNNYCAGSGVVSSGCP